jgi:hypothetical protein
MGPSGMFAAILIALATIITADIGKTRNSLDALVCKGFFLVQPTINGLSHPGKLDATVGDTSLISF